VSDNPSGHLSVIKKCNKLRIKIKAVCVVKKSSVLPYGCLTVQLPLQHPITTSIFHPPPVRDTHTHTHTHTLVWPAIHLFQHFSSSERERRMFSADKIFTVKITAERPAFVVQGQRQQTHSTKTV